MKLSLDTVHLLAGADCPETKKAVDTMIEEAYKHFVKTPDKKKKLYFSFRTVEGKIFLETETRPA